MSTTLERSIVAERGDQLFAVVEPRVRGARKRVQRITLTRANQNHLTGDDGVTYLASTGAQMGPAALGGPRALHPIDSPELLAIEAADKYRETLNALATATTALAVILDPLADSPEAAVHAALTARAEAQRVEALTLRAAQYS